ncbi:MAG TPA: general secretion pathway protein GspK [Candidatus Sulfotelmatobacter sp.]|nr:general secretion pathway protein GspK [Candidatus Sulfotelmatobacter sp.]
MKLPICSKARTHSFALIVALLAVFVLTANAALLWYSMQVDMKLAAKSQNAPNLLWLGRSGMDLAAWILAQEANIPNEPYDSLNEFWAGGPGGIMESNSPLAGIPMDHFPVGQDGGWVSIKIIDLERYANINNASPQLLQQALTAMGVDANDIPVVSDSILDWVQAGDNPRMDGAKNQYYQSLSPPYYCKEAPMDDISELLLVKGVTAEMYTGQGTGPKTAAPKGFAGSPFENNGYAFGLRDVFTPFSIGMININTADANVLQLIPGVDESTAEAIIKTRSGPDGVDGTSDDTPYRSPGDVQRAGINQEAAQNISTYCGVRSETFKVFVTAHYLNSTRQYVGILWRNNPQDIRCVQFYWVPEQQPGAATSGNGTAGN